MAAVNRYRFTEKTVKQAKQFLKGDAKTQPNFLKKHKGTIDGGKLKLDGKLVVPKERVEAFLRNKVYQGKTPLSRDAAFYWINKNTVGVSRKAVDDFLKTQRIIRETDNQQPTTKGRKKRRVNKKGQIHVDLVEIKFKDLGDLELDSIMDIDHAEKTLEQKAEGEDEVSKGYFFGAVDALTSLSYFKFAKFKNHKYITRIAKHAFEWMSKQLQVPMKRLTVFSDSGSEFAWKTWKKWGIKTFVVKMSPIIEQRNSAFQRIFYRVAKMKKTKNIHKLTALAVAQLNRTVSSVSKKAPIENLKATEKDVAEKYNKKRGKGSGAKIKSRALVPGKDRVRVQLIHAKDKAIKYKAYKGIMWSKRLYSVKSKKGNRYIVNGKLRHRDELRLTEDYDQKSEELLASRED